LTQLLSLDVEPMCRVNRQALQDALSAMQHAGGQGDHLSARCEGATLALVLHEGLNAASTIAIDAVDVEAGAVGAEFRAYPRDLASVIRNSQAPALRLEVTPDQYLRITSESDDDNPYDGTFEAVFPIVRANK
jgi:hypothetical protein